MDHHFTLHGIFHHSYRCRWTERFRSNRDDSFLYLKKREGKCWKEVGRNFLECALYLENASHAIDHRLHALAGPVDVMRDDENQIEYKNRLFIWTANRKGRGGWKET